MNISIILHQNKNTKEINYDLSNLNTQEQLELIKFAYLSLKHQYTQLSRLYQSQKAKHNNNHQTNKTTPYPK